MTKPESLIWPNLRLVLPQPILLITWISLTMMVPLAACTPKIYGLSSHSNSTVLAGPHILSITPPANGVYGSGMELLFSVIYSEPVIVSGSPTLQIQIGASTVQASYVLGSGSGLLLFHTYTQYGQVDADGIDIQSPLLLPPGSSIQSAKGTNASLDFTAPDTSLVRVNALQPTLAISASSASGVLVSTGSVSFNLTYSGATNIHLIPANITLNTTGGSSCTVGVTGGTTLTPVVTLTSCTGIGGTVGISVLPSTADDGAGHLALGAGPSSTVNALGIATLAWSPLTNGYGSNPVLTPTNGVNYTLNNSGTLAASGCSAPVITGTNPGDFQIFSDTCGTSALATAGTCVVNVRAQPTAVGARTATLSRTCTVGGTVSTTADGLTTTGTSGLAWASDNTYLGESVVGKVTGAFQFNFQNQSKVAATGCMTATLSNTTDFQIVSDACGVADSAGQSTCAVKIRGMPQATGTQSSTLTRVCATGSAILGISVRGFTTTPVSIVAGSSHTCMNVNDGSVRCWGNGEFGELGYGGLGSTGNPIGAAIGQVNQLALGMFHTCGLRADNTVWCWGSGGQGQLGDGTNSYFRAGPVQVSGLAGATQIAAGRDFTCAVVAAGAVKCWGNGGPGDFGNGTTASSNVPIAGPALTGFTQLAAGDQHMCGLRSDKTVRCWGQNFNGALGDGTTNASSTPVNPGLAGVTQIAAGKYSSCALLTNQTVQCWGRNEFGQLGGGAAQYTGPTLVAGLASVTQIAVGSGNRDGTHVCAVLSGGTIQCLGWNHYGQLGDGTFTSRNSPVTVAGISGATQVTVGNYHTCAILSSSRARCWGSNGYGQLGGGGLGNSTPVQVASVSSVLQVAQGDDFTCVLITGGTVKCWGNNEVGQLGDGTILDHFTPTTVPGLANVLQLAAGRDAVCALLNDSSVKCWGNNYNGKLGLGDNTPRLVPTVAPGWGTPVALGQTNEMCAIYADNSAKCSGSDASGMLGDGASTDRNVVTPVTVVSNIDSIVHGYQFGCARKIDGTVSCWGLNGNNTLGDGTSTSRLTAASVPGLTNVTQVIAYLDNTCALLSNATIQCWGSANRNGDGSNSNQALPSALTSLSGVSSLSNGGHHACALLSDKTVKCWGENFFGDLGDGSNNQRLSPVPVYGLSNVQSLWSHSAGFIYHSCAIKMDGTLWCWGSDTYYETTGTLSAGNTVVSGY